MPYWAVINSDYFVTAAIATDRLILALIKLASLRAYDLKVRKLLRLRRCLPIKRRVAVAGWSGADVC
jgi:hypothetical protein